MQVENWLKNEVIENIKENILQAENREIFLRGSIDPDSEEVDFVEILARGNQHSVPAIISELKPGDIVIHNHPSGNLEPSGPDIRIASNIGQKGVGFAIINNKVDDIYVVVEPQQPKERKELNQDKIIDYFLPDGAMDDNLGDYEFREQQLEVVKKVIASFNEKEKYFIEAGTGTGKSFAYLLPALFWNNLNQEPVVVSTNTINLQEQIVNKDLVFLDKLLPFEFKAVLVKGRRNYICRRKVNNLEQKAEDIFADEPEQQTQFIEILNWLDETKTGSRSDLDFLVKGDLWSQVVSESDLCIKNSCPFFNKCFFMKARKEIYDSDILVVNHHLLLSDAKLKQENQGLLPDYRHLIIDEAHNFERTATNHLGNYFTGYILDKFLQRIDKSRYSVIANLRNEVSVLDKHQKKETITIIDEILAQTEKVKEVSSDYFNKLKEFFDDEDENMLRLTEEIVSTSLWSTILEKGDNLIGWLERLGIKLDNLYQIFNMLTPNKKEDLEERIIELESINRKCQELISLLNFNLQAEDENHVFWLEKSSRFRDKNISQKNAPLNVSDILPEILWERLDNLVITSATLTINGNFKFFKRSLGTYKAQSLKISSPFDYKKQAKLLIPEDIPPANSNNFLSEIMDDFQDILSSFGGQTMVLFTSYYMLNHCLNKTQNDLANKGINILAQGEYPRHYIINNFKANKKQIIFGTVSFWEGVDIKGEDLKYLIIMKLPFPVPSRPIASARKELLENQGKNPFFHYSLPRAVIRFKQGFGRLIRSRNDEGIIISFDNRLLSKSYGKIFLNSLPSSCPVKKTSIKNIAGLN